MDLFIEKLSVLMRSRKLGDPAEKDTFQGSQGDKARRDRIVSILEDAKTSGELVMCGASTTVNGKNVPGNATISREEVFGPVVIVNSFKTEDEVLARANDAEYGLFGSVYTKDLTRALRFAKDMEAGAIGVNCSAPTQGLDMPVGGWKQSGVGKENHLYSMENFLETKAVYLPYTDVEGH